MNPSIAKKICATIAIVKIFSISDFFVQSAVCLDLLFTQFFVYIFRVSYWYKNVGISVTHWNSCFAFFAENDNVYDETIMSEQDGLGFCL